MTPVREHGARPSVQPDRGAGVEPALLWVLGAALVLLSAGYLWQVLIIPEPPRVLEVAVGAYPLLVAWLMIVGAVASAAVLGRESIRWRAGEVPESAKGENEVSSWPDLAVGTVGIIALILLMPDLGYVFCASVFVIGVATYYEPRKIVRNAITGVVLALSTYVLFDYLGVRLPEGIIPLPLNDIMPY